MPDNKKLVAAVEDYFDDLRKIKASGGGTAETSYYPPLTNLLNAVGGSLKPKCVLHQPARTAGRGPPRFRPFRRQAGVQGPAQAGSAARGRRGGGQSLLQR